MTTIAKKAQPACTALLRQATAKWPKRSKKSDGLLPSAAHIKQSPNSDHNTGFGVDLTHDPVNGPDCSVLFKTFRDDPRVKYLIHNGKIWSKEKGENPYKGVNPHKHHLHVSVKDGMGADTSPWFKEEK